MKMKKFFASLLATVTALSCCLFSGCMRIEWAVPKKYGDWDGNYIYCENMRCKTTGEDEERLVEIFEKDGIKYEVKETFETEYVNDYVYLCLNVREMNTEETEISCLVRYNIKEKKTEPIYFETDGFEAKKIYKVSDSFIVLKDGEKIFRIDYSGNIINVETEDVYKFEKVGDYLVSFQNGRFSYRTWEDVTMHDMFTVSNNSSGVSSSYFEIRYIEEAGQKGFLITARRQGLWYYDLLKDETRVLIDSNKVCSIVEDYIVAGSVTKKTFQRCVVTSSPPFWTRSESWYTTSYIMATHCSLYKIKLGEDGVVLEKYYDFNGKHLEKDFMTFIVAFDGKLYFTAEEVVLENVSISKEGEVKFIDYCFDPETRKLSRTNSDIISVKKSKEWLMKTYGVVCDKYIYYVDEMVYDTNKWYLYWDSDKADVLYRYDTISGKTEIMQFMAREEDMKNAEDLEFRYAKSFFEYYRPFSYESKFTVKSY